MKTLYDLLGALPDDDAESLRTAFRQAAKATHPDANTDDPDAPLKFRQIVRANAILSDSSQRATYDRLLALALRQSRSKPKRSFFSATMRKVASDAIAVVILSVVLIGGYAVFAHLSKADIPAKVVTVAAHAPAGTAGTSPPQLDTTSQAAPRDEPRIAAVPDETVVPGPGAPTANADGAPATAAAGAAPDLAANDAKSLHERGIVALLGGDLYRALADFDVAIQIDPGFADAYLDRGIVFYRIHERDRAFADIAEAKRIKSSNGTNSPPPAPHQASPSSARN